MDSNVAAASCCSAGVGDKRKRDTNSGAVERQPKVGTSLTKKESEVYQLIDSLGDLIDKKVRSSAGGKDEKEISMYKKKNSELENKLKNLKAEIYDAKEALMQCKLEKEEGKAHAAVPDQLIAQVDELKKRVKSQKAQLASTLQSEKKLQEEVEQLQADHAVALEASLSAQHACIEELERAKQDLLDTQAKLTEQQKLHLQVTQQLQAEKKTLEDALEKKIAEYDSVSKAFTDIKNMNENIMLKSQPLLTERAQLAKQVESLTAEYEAYQVEQISNVKALTDEVNTLKSALAQANTEKERYVKEKNEIELQFLRLKHGPVLSHGEASSNSLAMSSTNVNNVVPTIPIALTFPSYPSTSSVNAADDLSVLSDTTNHTDRRSAAKALSTVASAPSRRVVIANSSNDHTDNRTTTSLTTTIYNNTNTTTNAINRDTSKITIPKEPTSYNAILITTSQQVNIPAIRAEAAKLGNIISACVLPSSTGYKVEYDSPDDASLAVYTLNNRVIDGATLTVTPFVPPPPFESAIPDSDSHHGDYGDNPPVEEKIHLRLVHVLHNAPEKYQITYQSLKSELKRYGEVVNMYRMPGKQAFRAEFRFADDARRVIRNFVPSMNGFRIYCKSHYNQLPDPAVEPVPDTARSAVASPPLILRDPVLSENRPLARERERERGDGVPKLFCQHCFDAKRMALVKTHVTEKCRHALGLHPQMSRNGHSCSSSGSSNSGAARERRESPDRDLAPRARTFEREFERDRERDRDRRTSNNDSGRSNDAGQANDDGSLIVNGGVRPLSSKR